MGEVSDLFALVEMMGLPDNSHNFLETSFEGIRKATLSLFTISGIAFPFS